MSYINHRRRLHHRGSSPRVGVKAAIAAGFTPVPIPNTEVKPASVPVSTGVREPLGNSVRRLYSYFIQPSHSDNAVRGFSSYIGTLKRANQVEESAPRWQSLAERVRLQSGSSPVQIRALACAVDQRETAIVPNGERSES